MFSYLNSSVSTPSASSASTPSVINDVEKIKQYKLEMKAVPNGLQNYMSSNSRGNRHRKKGRNGIVSKTYNSVAGRPLSIINNPQGIYSAVLRADFINIVATSVTVPVYTSTSFLISAFADYAAYLALFDQYRFDELEVWFEPQSAPAALSGALDTTMIATAIDLDDANAPTSYGSCEAHQSAITTVGYASHYHKWKPHMAVAVYSGAFTSFSNAPAGWIDSASPNVQHYGFKFASQGGSTVVQHYNMSCRAKVSFRQSGL